MSPTRFLILVSLIEQVKKVTHKKLKMTDLLLFYPQGKYLCIEFLGARYIERQPKTPEEAQWFMEEVKPIIQQLDEYVLAHNLKEVIELNLRGVPISKLNSDTALHLIEMLTKIRPDKNILEKIRITNINPIFNMIYKSIKNRLPERVVSIIDVESNSKFF
jgi:hypothetical protein